MNRPLAVRFLLLKHLWKLRAQAAPDRYKEITRSLSVGSSATGYLVRWRDGGQAREYAIPSPALSLYARGDTTQPPASEDDDERTEQMARTFARQALGLSPAAGRPQSSPRIVPWVITTPIVALVVVGIAGGRALAPASTILVAATLAEIWAPWGLFVLTGVGFGLAAVGPPILATAWNLVMCVLQCLSPYARGRAFRALGHLAAVPIALVLSAPAVRAPDGVGLFLCVVAILLAIGRSAYGSHRRLMPIGLALSLGALAVEGWTVPAALGLTILAGELAFLAARPGGSPID